LGHEKALGPHHPDLATPLNNLAALFTKEEKAIGSDRPNLALYIHNLAALYANQGQYADAEMLHKRLLAIFGASHPDIARTFNDLAATFIAQGRYAEALPLVRDASQMGFEQKSLYLAVLTGANEKNLLARADAFNEGYQVVQRGMSSSASKAINQLSVRFGVGDDQLAQLVRRDQDLYIESEALERRIIEVVSKDPTNRVAAEEQQMKSRLQLIAGERAQIESTLYQRFPDYATLAKPKPLSVQETQQLLADDEALIVFDFDRQSCAGVFTRSDADAFALTITARELEDQVKNLRSSIMDGPQFDAQASYRLYQSTFGAFAQHIKSKKRLSVVMNGALSSLPLQLLVISDPSGGEPRERRLVCA
jgi:hypothetical protein